MRITVTGAGGGLGQTIPDVFVDDELTLVGRDECDITNAEQTQKVVTASRPDVVIHAAAYTKVDQAESEPELAEQVNVTGTLNVAKAAAEAGAVLVYPSTDYVFDGGKNEPYTEDDEANPLSVYGHTKLAGESAALINNPKSFVVRTAWLYSQAGKSFATTILRLLDEKDSLSVVADEVSSPIYAKDFVEGLRRLLETESYGLYHLSAAGETSWHGYAEAIAERAGKQIPISQTTSVEYGLPAQRPRYSKLDSSKIEKLGIEVPDWQDSLDRFFADREETRG